MFTVLFCNVALASMSPETQNKLTFSMIKPEAVAQGLSGDINADIQKAGLKIVAQKMLTLTSQDVEKFYEVHKGKPFFQSLVDQMANKTVIVQVLMGTNDKVIEQYRNLMGATNPQQAKPNTLRAKYAKNMPLPANAVHGSDSAENAKAEIFYFFSEREICLPQ